MAARKSAPRKKTATKPKAARKKTSPPRKSTAAKKSAARGTRGKAAPKSTKKVPPSTGPPPVLTAEEAVEDFLGKAEVIGPAVVRAAIARRLAKTFDRTGSPGVARQLRETVAGINPGDSDEPDDWTTK